LRFRYGFRTLFYPELAQYRYRLEGQKTDWTYTGTTREALFGDLKAGDYKFEVQARYPWQAWSSTAGTYAFKVKEAYWRTWWFWFLFAFVISGITFIWARDRWQRREKRLRLENDLLDMERKALRLQMNPHFIFNALDSISSFIFKKDPKMAVRYLNNFAKLMRLTLESSMEHIHPVETEVSILKNYLELEKLRFNAKFDYEIVVDEDLDYDIGLPPMLVQPHVENAILHGLKPKDGPGFIHISFKLDGEYLCCTIDDDGIGREKAKDLPGKKAHRSMATQINKDRIDLLKRSLDEDIYLNIIDKHNQQGEATGTTVIIRLPAQDF
jgi:LytS/YehU family sensor histidine kinase